MVASNRPDRNQDQRPSWVRFLIGLFKFILLLAVLAVGGFLGYMGWQQFNVVNSRFEVVNSQLANQSERIDLINSDYLLRNEVNGLIREQISPEVGTLSAEIDAIEDEMAAIETLEETITNGLTAQEAAIATLQDEQAALAEALAGVSEELASIQTDVTAVIATAGQLESEITSSSENGDFIQQTLNALESQLTILESNLSTLETDLSSLDTRVTSISTATVPAVADEPAQTTPAEESAGTAAAAAIDYRIVRLYGMVIRAKVHINEGDLESANNVLEEAQTAVEALSDGAEGEVGEALASVGENIATATESLSGKPTLSNLALDDAWSAMDALLLQLSGN